MADSDDRDRDESIVRAQLADELTAEMADEILALPKVVCSCVISAVISGAKGELAIALTPIGFGPRYSHTFILTNEIVDTLLDELPHLREQTNFTGDMITAENAGDRKPN